MTNIFGLFLLQILLLTSPVWSSTSHSRRGIFGIPFLASSEEASGILDNEPLRSEPVPLPAIKNDDSAPSLFKLKRPCFDVISIKAPSISTATRKKHKQPRPKQQRHPNRNPCGTRFDLRAPSPEKITQWFAPAEEGLRRRKRQLSALFNHDSVGMTNPVLGVSNTVGSATSRCDATSSPSASVALASTSTTTAEKHFELEESLIPATQQQQQKETKTKTIDQDAFNQWARVLQYKLRPQYLSRQAAEEAWFPSTQQQNPKRKWRQCRYRRRVGQGQACYERVREAALEWQFQRQNDDKGILPVQSAPHDNDSASSSCFSLDSNASKKVQPIWSGPHTGGSRRLVTFTTCGIKSIKWLPKLYALNPVMVVYDLLDQRGPGTTYSATAYSTLKGHLLSGEERVTVALRDDTGFVDVEILSYSRPGPSLRSKFVWPVIGRMQHRFFDDQMDFLEQVALPEPPPATTNTPK